MIDELQTNNFYHLEMELLHVITSDFVNSHQFHVAFLFFLILDCGLIAKSLLVHICKKKAMGEDWGYVPPQRTAKPNLFKLIQQLEAS